MYYGFGIIRANSLNVELLKKLGLNQELPCLIIEGDLGMLCAEIAVESMAMATRESMSRYTEVLCQVIKYTTVVPLRFGTLFDQEEEIRKVLRKEKSNYLKFLTKLDNKIEVELKVWWKKESFQETMMKNKRLGRWKKALERGVGQGYDVVEFGKAIMEVADYERKEVEKSFLAMLRPLAVEWVVKEPMDEFQAFDGVYLVERQKEEAFDQAVGVLYEKCSATMIFKYTGPWAPHHFVNEK
ncbi:Gas vesicle synthesis GvpL/GvpF family protein [Candidatus Desulfosporosinus infrequens]|uniref:Gas vesicle synthesis GvpL/GvpF family protein n=1 Tax=Candidatus Desulfosporosinus infrequens TaxID=2043169 RepID=A0A2U3KYA6_9FIRM|nr:Gas vesicle synthesis GvpL/GvpF family protein [Candidatus Desulfosporosinus infrequens]